ncbi:MAG TPA: hypothetical protein VFE31_06550, partial [Opitutaceae bacterium]|nr:hypothetical protein [Opitutaceae bacterium]
DVILDLDRKPVHNADEAVKLSEQIKGPKVLVRYWRGGATQYVVVDESQAPSPSSSPSSSPMAPDSGGGDDDAK